jgi:hypothetical protein
MEWLLLPLDGGNDNPRALGSSIPLEKPFWIGSDPVVEMRITSLRVIDADREPLFLSNRPEISMPPLDIADNDLERRRSSQIALPPHSAPFGDRRRQKR